MAPYVEREWGEQATELMWRVKELADPDGVLAPGVVLNRDPGVHLRNLKTTPPIEESATTCVECGFCEPVCPSRHLTTTPRQRIVLRREIARQPEGSPLRRALLEEYEYDGLETCAADGSCQLACPVGIDTGALVKELRARAPRRARREAGALRRPALGRRRGRVAGGAARRRAAARRRTRRGRALPPAASSKLPLTLHEGAAAVYVPSCTNRIFGGSPVEALVEVSQARRAAGLDPRGRRRHLLRPALELERLPRRPPPQGERDGRAALGLERGGVAADRRRRRLLHAGASPPPARASSTRRTPSASPRLEILDSVAWAHDRLLPWLEVSRRVGSATVHPTCATRHMGLAGRLRALAGELADEVYVAPSATCCGFAGDRGISHPELTESATRRPGRGARRPRLRRPPLQQPHLRDRPHPRDRRGLRVVRDPARAAHAARRPPPPGTGDQPPEHVGDRDGDQHELDARAGASPGEGRRCRRGRRG